MKRASSADKSEYPIQQGKKFWGTLIFSETKEESDRLASYCPPTEKNFYQKFYSESANPLKRTREIQFQSLWKTIEKTMVEGPTLDIGCGKGEFVHLLRSKGLESYGIDPALEKETEYLKRAGLGGGTLCTEIPKEFGFISLLDVLEHFPETEKVLEEISLLLNPKGILLVKVPNKNAAIYQFAKMMRNVFPGLSTKLFVSLYQVALPPPHFHYFSEESLRSVLQKRFEIISSDYMSECPLGGLWGRFWMVPLAMRPLLICGALIYRLFSMGKRNDGIILVARKKPISSDQSSKN